MDMEVKRMLEQISKRRKAIDCRVGCSIHPMTVGLPSAPASMETSGSELASRHVAVIADLAKVALIEDRRACPNLLSIKELVLVLPPGSKLPLAKLH